MIKYKKVNCMGVFMLICKQCGRELVDNNDICAICGASQKDLHKTKTLKTILLSLFCILLIFSLVLNITFTLKMIRENSSVSNEYTTKSNDETTTAVEEIVFPTVDIKTLNNLGTFTSVGDMKKELDRNLNNPQYMKVVISGYIIRTEEQVYIWTYEGERGHYDAEVYLLIQDTSGESAYKKAKEASKVKIYPVYMFNDTTDRVLTGDSVKLTGIIDTKNGCIFGTSYKMIEINYF